jgi:hypothetical protein
MEKLIPRGKRRERAGTWISHCLSSRLMCPARKSFADSCDQTSTRRMSRQGVSGDRCALCAFHPAGHLVSCSADRLCVQLLSENRTPRSAGGRRPHMGSTIRSATSMQIRLVSQSRLKKQSSDPNHPAPFFLFGDRCCAIHSLALLQISSGKCYLLKGTDAKGCPIVVVHVRRHLPSEVPPRLHFQDGSLIVVIKRNILPSIALALHSLSETAGL